MFGKNRILNYIYSKLSNICSDVEKIKYIFLEKVNKNSQDNVK